MRYKRIVVLAATDQDTLESDGAAVEMEFDTIKDAKDVAKYYLTKEYMNVCESSTPLGYAQVVADDMVIYDYFAKA